MQGRPTLTVAWLLVSLLARGGNAEACLTEYSGWDPQVRTPSRRPRSIEFLRFSPMPIALPGAILATDIGDRVVMFENSRCLGRTEYAVVLYSGVGLIVRALQLNDLFTPEEIASFGYGDNLTVPWTLPDHPHGFDESQQVLIVRYASGPEVPGHDRGPLRERRVRLADGEVLDR